MVMKTMFDTILKGQKFEKCDLFLIFLNYGCLRYASYGFKKQ